MDLNASKNPQNIQWWIVSLAISVICCAILFVVFACYLVDFNKGNAVTAAITNVRLEAMEQRLSRMDNDIENLRRRTTVQQIQVVPSSQPVQLPVSVLPPAEAPAPTPSPAPGAAPGPAPAH